MIEKITQLVLTTLKDQGLVDLKVPAEKVLAKMRAVVTADMRAEADLDEEVERLLKSHSGELDGVDYRRMFSMVKQKLARERGVVL